MTGTRSRCWWWAGGAIGAVLGLSAGALAHTGPIIEPPPAPEGAVVPDLTAAGQDGPDAPPAPAAPADLSAALRLLLEAPYLTDEERAGLRAFHGLDDAAGLEGAVAAQAALLRGAWDHPALLDDATPVLDRAEAALERGDAPAALELARNNPGLRGARIRAGALEALGRFAEADRVAGDALDAAHAPRAPDVARDPADAVEAARLLALRLRRLATPPPDSAPVDAEVYTTVLEGLAEVRTRLSRTFWPAFLAEAEILYEKDNSPAAHEALLEALALNPRSAAAWALAGRMAVDAFGVDEAESIALRLDVLDRESQGPEGRPSALGAMIRARMLLRQDQPGAALEILDAALARYPSRRDLLELRCAAHGVLYDFEGMERALRDYDALAPGSPRALAEAGRAVSEARQYARAAELLGRARERAPAWSQPAIDLGLLEIQAGRDQDARQTLRDATRLDPFNVRAANSLRLVEELATYERVEGERFVVRYRPGPDAVLAREMPEVLDRLYAAVTGTGPGGLDHRPADRTIVDLMPDHEWFGVRIAGVPRIHTIAASTGPCIAMEAPRDGAGHQGTYDWERVVRHEFAHTVGLSRTGNRIPLWFTEASAVHLELAPRDYDTCRLLARALAEDELFDFTRINVAFVRPRRPSDRALGYAQGHWMYEFIIDRWGARAPLELMDLYAQGVREEAAFERVLGTDRSAFMAAFRDWARAQARSWGLALEDGVPPVRQLVAAEAVAAGGITLELVESWLSRYPAHPEVLELAVRMRLEEAGGRATPDMVDLLRRYAAARPVDPLPHRLLAQMLLESDDPLASAPHLEFLDAREERTPTYAAALAGLYARAGRLDDAGARAERATRIAPYDAQLRELAATVAIMRSDRTAAERHLVALTELEPDRPVHARRLEAFRARTPGAQSP